MDGKRLFEAAAKLLPHYNRPVPRYTSYPPAPHWQEAGGELLISALRSSAAPLSIYVHIPFCESLCLYCGCNVVISRNHSRSQRYVEHVIAEMDLLDLAHGRLATQMHWGGGTPTYLNTEQMRVLSDAIVSRFAIPADAEISVEIDPRVTTKEHLRTLRQLGFNRLSAGIQDFDPRVQRAVHRIQSFELTEELLAEARILGFEGVNVDLIYGLPFQTRSSFNNTLDLVLTLSPDRIAAFSYAHVPSVKRQQRALENYLPSEEDKLGLYITAIDRFTSAGYEHIGLDHFALRNDPLAVELRNGTLHRNFQGYTTHAEADLLAFGVSSISSVGGAFTQNYRELPLYEGAITAGRIPVIRGYSLTEDDRVRGAVIEKILCHAYLKKSEIEEPFGIDFDTYFGREVESLEMFEHDGLIESASGPIIRVTPVGRLFIRCIGQVFDAFKPAAVASRAV